MSIRPPWNYVQARLQARHGERLDESEWRALEAVRSLDQFIERSRATSLQRFTEQLNASMSGHAIERALRSAGRAYVAEVASWGAEDWRPAILWTALLPDLPIIDALLRGEVPRWALKDPALSAFLDGERGVPQNSALAALLPVGKRERTLAERWYAHWCSLWPKGDAELSVLTFLAETVRAHVARLERAGLQDTSVPYRRDLAQKITRMFRRHGGTPTAAFCHLALVTLDLERLRGDLVRRHWFEPAPAKEAA